MKTEPSGRWLISPLTIGSAEREVEMLFIITVFPLWSKHHALCTMYSYIIVTVKFATEGKRTKYFDKVASKKWKCKPLGCIIFNYLSHSLDTSSFPGRLCRRRNMQKSPFLFFETQPGRIRHTQAHLLLRTEPLFGASTVKMHKTQTIQQRENEDISRVSAMSLLWSADLVEILKSWEIHFRYVRRFLKRPCTWVSLLIISDCQFGQAWLNIFSNVLT